ncbi:10530_t:CDS:2 [Cetraspora pellucida]|uniref:10530_t:CDS:1 n=1 Tax=Cetraspora pellucida TaxID=1433469 RepID=A0A9N8ZQL7_9GLOM|nr:10530_t:CDS:2 [Cetraspora pellucida]
MHNTKCAHFNAKSTVEEREEIFKLTDISIKKADQAALQWVNKPKAAKLFEFLNPLLKLPNRCLLRSCILNDAIKESDKAMLVTLKEDHVNIILIFDRWTNVRNEYLFGAVIIISEGRLYV